MPLRIRWNDSSLLQQSHRRFTWLRARNLQPILYPIHTPIHLLVRCTVSYVGVVDGERLDRFCVAGFGAVNGDEMENAVVAFAMHGEADTNDHREDCEW